MEKLQTYDTIIFPFLDHRKYLYDIPKLSRVFQS